MTPIEVGIGIPTMFPEARAELVLEWARRAEASGFCSLSSGERIAFGSQDLLISMAMMAAVTDTIRIMTTVLAAPLHGTALLAKQAATLDVLSGGRFVLGLGISERPEDFAAVGVPYQGRGARFERQLVALRRLWSGEPPEPAVSPVGPRPVSPGGPPVLIGAFTPPALRRAGVLADGLLSFGFSPDPGPQAAAYEQVREAWQETGRPGRPRFVAGTYFALGPEAAAKAERWIRRYYGYLPTATQDGFLAAVPRSDSDVAAAIKGFEAAGADEVYFSPMIPELDQVERLASLIPGRAT